MTRSYLKAGSIQAASKTVEDSSFLGRRNSTRTSLCRLPYHRWKREKLCSPCIFQRDNLIEFIDLSCPICRGSNASVPCSALYAPVSLCHPLSIGKPPSSFWNRAAWSAPLWVRRHRGPRLSDSGREVGMFCMPDCGRAEGERWL